MPGPVFVPGLNLDRPWMFTSVANMRAEGCSTRDVDDARLRDLIIRYSETIVQATNQWFAPVRGTALLTGDDTPMIYLPNMIPIIAVEELRLRDGSDFLLEPTEYVVGKTTIELIDVTLAPSSMFGATNFGEYVNVISVDRQIRGVGRGFPSIPQGVAVTGVFGWIEGVRVRNPGTAEQQYGVATTLAAELDSTESTAPTPLTLTLDDVTGIRVDDIVLVGDAGDSAWVLAVNTEDNELTVEPIYLEGVYAAETPVYCYGRVPRDIENCAQLLAYYFHRPKFRSLQTEFAPPATPELPVHGAGPESFNPNMAATGGNGMVASETGVPRVDQILTRYRSTQMVAVI